DLVIDRVGALGEALQEAQVPFDYVAVEREIAVGKAVKPEYRVDAGIKALSARIPVVPSAEIERERTEGRTEPAEDVDLGSRAIRERDALARNAHVVLQVLGDVVAWFEIARERWPVVGLGDAAEDIIRRDPPAERNVPRTWRRLWRCWCLDLHVGRQCRRRERDGGHCT